jgi:pimeloyl-ACP methyl ester carboxylesterase
MTTPAIEKKLVPTSFGDIAYLETGAAGKPPVLFVHGIPTSSYLWRHVLRFLQNDFHCYAPDLMGLGDTEVDPDATEFHMDAQAEMLVEFMAALGHQKFALVCHDQGGAAAQIIAARLPELVTCFILTNCVCYDNWPVPAIARMQRLARLGPLVDLLNRTGVMEWTQRNPLLSDFLRGVHDKSKLDAATIREYLRPTRGSAVQRERFRKILLAGDSRYTQLAAEGLRKFDHPTMVIWAADDYYLSPSWGRKLYEEIPGAERFELVPFCGHFWPEERPAAFASLMGEFLSRFASGQPSDRKGKSKTRLPVVDPPAEGAAS